MNGDVIWQASDSSLSKELHGYTIFSYLAIYSNEKSLNSTKHIGQMGSKFYQILN